MRYSPYSFSKIQTFFECPKKFEFTYINKISIDREYNDPTYFKRGRFIHAYLADRLNGGTGLTLKRYDVDTDTKMDLVECADKTLNHDLIRFTYDFDANMIETRISLDKNLAPNTIKNKTAFSGYIDYYACKDDYGILIDWKSGKYHEHPNYFQLELYAIWVFQQYAHITEIDLVFFYVEHNKFTIKTIIPDDVVELKKELMTKIDIIENTSAFTVNKSSHCVVCPFFHACEDQQQA